jgi:hypothetical protein
MQLHYTKMYGGVEVYIHAVLNSQLGASTGTTSGVVTQRNMVMGPSGPGTKNGCAGEYQHQYTRPNDWPVNLCTKQRWSCLHA